MIRSFEIAAFFYFIFVDSLKLRGRRHSKCCEELCDGEERGRRGGTMLEVLRRRRGGSAGLSALRRGLRGVFGMFLKH